MRVLLDTNIVIHREANKVLNADIGLLFHWLDKLHVEKCVHPLSIEEVSKYQNQEIVDTIKVKIQNYHLLKTISPETPEIEEIRKSDNTENSTIDTSLLKELHNNRIDFFITEDRGIHRKARLLSINDRVFTIDSFLEKCISENPDLRDYKVLAVKKELFGNLNLNDPFFSSFKTDYAEFEKWFNEKSDKTSYVCITDGHVRAFLYVKVEDQSESYSDITPAFPKKRRLKIGTFKVTSTGYKLGERFLKVIFDNAVQYNVDEIYVTLFKKREEQERLASLLEDWGFYLWGEKNTGNGTEYVYVKDFSPNTIEPNSSPKKSYPFVSKGTNKFIVPIYPAYHTDLFPDSILRTESPSNFVENEPHRNAIQKVYISRSINRDIKRGDLVLFYRTGGYHKSVITTLAVVQDVYDNIENEDQFIRLCRKRSVFDNNELKRHWNYAPYGKWTRPFIVNFHYVYSFPRRLNMKALIELGVIADVSSAPRGFEPISNEKFETILRESNADESYIID